MLRRKTTSVLTFGALVIGSAFWGCGFETVGPADPVASRPARPPRVVSQTPQLAMVLPEDSLPESRVWQQVGRAEAGKAKALIRFHPLRSGDPPDRQAELIRQAAASRPSALIVVPVEAESVASALVEVRQQGLPVVVMDGPVDPGEHPRLPDEDPLLAHVTTPPFEPSAYALVEEALRHAEYAGFPPEGPVLILVNRRPTYRSDERVAALKHAVEAFGLTLLDVKSFEVTAAAAKEAVEQVYAEEPSLAIVLADEDQALIGAALAGEHLDSEEPRFVVAGFATFDSTLDMIHMGRFEAVVNQSVQDLARQAIRTALDLAAERDLPDRTIIVDMPLLNRELGSPPIEMTPRRMEEMMKKFQGGPRINP